MEVIKEGIISSGCANGEITFTLQTFLIVAAKSSGATRKVIFVVYALLI